MPEYLAQLNQDRAKSIKKFKAKLPEIIVQRMTQAIEDKEAWVWPLAFAFATLNDLADIGVIGSIPFLGDSFDIFCGIILTMLLWNIGGLIKWKVRGAIWLAGILEVVLGIAILPELIPFWIICIWYAHYQVGKKAESAKQGLKEYKKGKINKQIVAEFK